MIDADPAGLTVRKESLLPGGEHETAHWPRADLTTLAHRDSTVILHTRAGPSHALEVGRTYAERDWLTQTLRRVLNLPEPGGGTAREDVQSTG